MLGAIKTSCPNLKCGKDIQRHIKQQWFACLKHFPPNFQNESCHISALFDGVAQHNSVLAPREKVKMFATSQSWTPGFLHNFPTLASHSDHYTTCPCLVPLLSGPIWATFWDLDKSVTAAPALFAFCAPPHLLLPHKVDIAFLSSWRTITASQIGGWITPQAGGCSQYFMQTVDIIWLSLMTIWYPLVK